MQRIRHVHGQLVLGLQVVVGEHIQVRIEHLGRPWLARLLQAQGGHLGGAKLVATPGAAQAVARDLLGREAEHRKMVQVRAFAEHPACFGPGGVEQDEQRARGGAAWGGLGRQQLGEHARRIDELAGEHHIRLPLRVGQQR